MDITAFKEGQKALWSLGDFDELAKSIRSTSQTIIDAAGIAPGDRLLDVGCGTGNLAIPAAERGAVVTGVDLTPAMLDVARSEAAAAGVNIELHEGDVEALEFGDGEFDKVVSVFGMMFAPRHDVAASQMRRVCRPGGTIALVAWTPEGMFGGLFRTIGSHMPSPPEGFKPPLLWGTEEHVRENFDDAIDWRFTREQADFTGDSVEGFVEYMAGHAPPLVLARSVLEPQGAYDALHADLIDHFTATNEADDGRFLARAEYLLAVGSVPD
jgi:SAM-dependent methyltransferase